MQDYLKLEENCVQEHIHSVVLNVLQERKTVASGLM